MQAFAKGFAQHIIRHVCGVIGHITGIAIKLGVAAVNQVFRRAFGNERTGCRVTHSALLFDAGQQDIAQVFSIFFFAEFLDAAFDTPEQTFFFLPETKQALNGAALVF